MSSFPVAHVREEKAEGAARKAEPKRMAIVLPFIEREMVRVMRLLEWMAKLSGGVVIDRTLFLLPFKGLKIDPVRTRAAEVFSDVQVIADSEGVASDWKRDDKVRNAAGPNSFFRQAAWFFYFRGPSGGPWLYLEPDCVPLIAGWDAKLEEAYRTAGKAFLGAGMKWTNGDQYLNGAAIYSPNAVALAPGLATRTMWEQFPEKEIAFDIAGGAAVLNQAAVSGLIQLDYREEDPEPRKGAVLFHGDRSGKLLERLLSKGGDPNDGIRKVNDRANKSAKVKVAPDVRPVAAAASNGNGAHLSIGDQIRWGADYLAGLATNTNRKVRILRELRKRRLAPQR